MTDRQERIHASLRPRCHIAVFHLAVRVERKAPLEPIMDRIRARPWPWAELSCAIVRHRLTEFLWRVHDERAELKNGRTDRPALKHKHLDRVPVSCQCHDLGAIQPRAPPGLEWVLIDEYGAALDMMHHPVEGAVDGWQLPRGSWLQANQPDPKVLSGSAAHESGGGAGAIVSSTRPAITSTSTPGDGVIVGMVSAHNIPK